MKETTKRLKTAKLCLEGAVRERDEGRRGSLLFQFSRQMALFCDGMAAECGDKRTRNKLLSYASFFGRFARFWRNRRADRT